MSAHAQALPEPLCKPFPHVFRWTWHKIQLLVAAGLFAYLGMLAVAGLYYLLFEVYAPFTHAWHTVIPNSTYRHDVRDVGEGLLGGLAGQQVIWNHYKKSTWKAIYGLGQSRADVLEKRFYIPNLKDGKPFSIGRLFATPPLVLLYAIPGFLIGLGIAAIIHHFVHHVTLVNPQHLSPHAATFWAKIEHGFTSSWDKKLIGYLAAFVFGRRPAKAVFDDVQLLFVERRVASGGSLRWYDLPTFRARYNDVKNNGASLTLTGQSTLLKRAVLVGVALFGGLVIYGWYILTFVAPAR